MPEHVIEIPENVSVSLEDRKLTVKGPKGTIEKDFDDPRFNADISIEQQDGRLVVKFDGEKRKVKAMAGTIKAHARNMFSGAAHGYKWTMRIVYMHFPITVTEEKGKIHVKNFLGEKGSRIAKIVSDTKVHVDKESITLTGTDKESVSQTAANIERACKLSKRDRRIFQDGIYIEGGGSQ